jgi:hypothetical protein
MGIDDAEGRRLFTQMREDARQYGMLDDIRKGAGVKGVAVVHGGRRCNGSCAGVLCAQVSADILARIIRTILAWRGDLPASVPARAFEKAFGIIMWRLVAATAVVYGYGHPAFDSFRPEALDRPFQSFYAAANDTARDGHRLLANLDGAKHYLKTYVDRIDRELRPAESRAAEPPPAN